MQVSNYTLAITAVVLIFICLSPSYSQSAARDVSSLQVQTDSVRRLSAGINDFGFRLTKELYSAPPRENVFISPLSVHLALGMTFMGAEAETETEMAEVLGLQGLRKQEVAALAAKLMERLKKNTDVDVSVANSIWSRKGFQFKKDFLKTGEKFFEAEIAELDFSSPEALETINNWISENTNGKIEKIVKKLSPLDVMVLLNAIYFEGPWKDQFKEENTTVQRFHLGDGSEKFLPMMSRSGRFYFLGREKFKLIRIPYGNNEPVAAYVVLPEEKLELGELIDNLDRKKWEDWVSSLERAEGHLVLPKFELRFESKLNDPLKDLGMELPFDRVKADLTGIIDLLTRNAYISSVRHKTFLEVTERGTEAAAATSVKISLTGLGPTQDDFEMIVDRPFLFAIRHEETGALLFLGGIRNPQKSSKY
ncbi:serpin family protein [Candidatus Bipolaricaulota bacterium]|nr:serpin family protein [Candidatus Bipolaricaulota bacterium]